MKGYDEKYLQSCIDKAKKSWEGVDTDKFMNGIREKEDVPSKELNKAAEEYAQDEMMSGLAERAFKAGAEWQRERMLKDAVDVLVESPLLGPPMVCCIAKGCNNGDKVKLIIIKEEK